MPLYAAALFVVGSSNSVLGRFIRSSLESGGVMKVTHIVGMQGSGKSTIARLIVADLESRGGVCAVVDSDAMHSDFKHDAAAAKAAFPQVEHLFLESHFDHFNGAQEGERVIAVWFEPEPELAQALATTAPAATETVAGQGG